MIAVRSTGSAELPAIGLVAIQPAPALSIPSIPRPASLVQQVDQRDKLLPSPMPASRDLMLAAVPSLRAFAISLCRNADRADDLVQETLLRALSNIDSFQLGTNMPAWLFTILRNHFRSEYRKGRREVEDVDGRAAEKLESHPDQISHLEFQELREALAKLPIDQREALTLVGVSGFSYQDAAKVCHCAVGTIKSRVNRARSRLSQLLLLDNTPLRTHERAEEIVAFGHAKSSPHYSGGFNSPANQPTASVFIGSTAKDTISVRSQVEHSNVRSSKPRLPGETRAKAIRCLHTGHIGRVLRETGSR
ncbi:RNA polymerase sigma factor (sigma-70 family) [Bradyrhizobium japonicum]